METHEKPAAGRYCELTIYSPLSLSFFGVPSGFPPTSFIPSSRSLSTTSQTIRPTFFDFLLSLYYFLNKSLSSSRLQPPPVLLFSLSSLAVPSIYPFFNSESLTHSFSPFVPFSLPFSPLPLFFHGCALLLRSV